MEHASTSSEEARAFAVSAFRVSRSFAMVSASVLSLEIRAASLATEISATTDFFAAAVSASFSTYVYTEGITKITAKDVEYAEEFGDVIKLLGVAHNTEEGIEVAVHPMMIPKEHPLASVRDSFNAVFVRSDAAGDTMFYGRGAGELPTASAIMGDVIDVIRDIQYHCTGRISCTCYRETPVKNFKEVKNKFYIRMLVDNKPGVLAAIASVFGVHKVSIARVIQNTKEDDAAELVIVTEAVKEKHLEDALAHLVDMDTTREIGTVIREY